MFASLARNFAVVALVAFVAGILFCAWSINTMAMEKPVNDCVSQRANVAICSAGPQGHLLVWQNFLSVTPQKIFDFLIASLLFVVGFFISRRQLHAPFFGGQYLHAKIKEGLFIIDPIRRALARGIIQPHIYELVIG